MKWFKREEMPEWRKHPNPYLQLHLQIYPQYLEERDAGTYDPQNDPFCSAKYILSHPFKNFKEIPEGGKLVDQSETYILQCKKAEEIQKLNPCSLKVFEGGNFYSDEGEVSVAEYESFVDDGIWLPRLDQLVKLVSENWLKLCNTLWTYAGNNNLTESASLEQLTLEVVMWEKFSKLWDGQGWVKIPERLKHQWR